MTYNIVAMPQKPVTNDDILELLQESKQMTSDGFIRLDNRMGKLEDRMDGLDVRMDGLDGRMDGLETRMGNIEGNVGSLVNRIAGLERQYTELKITVDHIANEQKAQTNDIKEILDRLLEIEKRLPNITEIELREMQNKLQAIVNWAQAIAKKEGIPLKLS